MDMSMSPVDFLTHVPRTLHAISRRQPGIAPTTSAFAQPRLHRSPLRKEQLLDLEHMHHMIQRVAPPTAGGRRGGLEKHENDLLACFVVHQIASADKEVV